jgi:hypothetical protein
MRLLISLICVCLGLSAWANDISLTVEQYDSLRQRASIKVMDTSQVPLNTILRVHGKTGTCEIRVIEQVNDHLIGATTGCDNGVLNPGMNLAYSQPNAWEKPSFEPAAYRSQTQHQGPSTMADILDRTSIFIGHNFSRQLEGNVYSDGSARDLRGGTALTLGVKGRVYDFTDRLALAVELGYESPRTLDRETRLTDEGLIDGGTIGYSPRLSLWSLAVLGEAKVMDGMTGFLGGNLTLPNLSNSPFSIGSGIGFQAGVNYEVWDKVLIEGLVNIRNMSLRNDIGQTTDVSLAGFELRGRYNF